MGRHLGHEGNFEQIGAQDARHLPYEAMPRRPHGQWGPGLVMGTRVGGEFLPPRRM
jgi:hypothetical protein